MGIACRSDFGSDGPERAVAAIVRVTQSPIAEKPLLLRSMAGTFLCTQRGEIEFIRELLRNSFSLTPARTSDRRILRALALALPSWPGELAARICLAYSPLPAGSFLCVTLHFVLRRRAV